MVGTEHNGHSKRASSAFEVEAEPTPIARVYRHDTHESATQMAGATNAKCGSTESQNYTRPMRAPQQETKTMVAKKKPISPTHDAVANWHGRTEAVQPMQAAWTAARVARERAGTGAPLSARLAEVEAERRYLEAVEAAVLAEVEAGAALAASDTEAEDGDLAAACDLSRLRADFAELEGEEARLTAALQATRQAKVARATKARAARESLVARRALRGLPPPPRIPETVVGYDAFATPMTRAIDEALAKGPAVPGSTRRTHRLAELEQEATRFRAALERERQAETDRRAAASAHERAKGERAQLAALQAK